jgi:hypothetical protein
MTPLGIVDCADPSRMSYFDTRLGKRPASTPSTEQSKHETPSAVEPTGLFAASTGARPSGAGQGDAETRRRGDAEVGWEGRISAKRDTPGMQSVHPVADNEHNQRPATTVSPCHQACPLCRSDLVSERGLWRCQGRCGAKWLEEGGRLLDLASLPFGICTCCKQPAALIRTDDGVQCPGSGRGYLLLPEGARLRDEAAPYGVCLCCTPAMPLVMLGDVLVCRAKPQQRYTQAQGQVVAQPEAPAHDLTATHAAIDAALRRNSARVAVNGLFDLE